MSSLNSVQLIGNLGKFPEVLKSTDKVKFVRLSLATTKKYRDAKQEIVEDTQWHTVYLNGSAATFASSYLKKGDKVLIVGELRTTQWKDKTGEIHYSTAVYAKECKSLTVNLKAKETEISDAGVAEYKAFYEEVA